MRKKLFLLIIITIIIFTGCSNQNKPSPKTNDEKKESKVLEKIDSYKDNNNTPIAFYRENKKEVEYKTNIRSGVDIGVFQIYPSSEEYISYNGSYGDSFYEKWQNYNKDGNLKIGYNLTYSVKDNQVISHNILSVKDTKTYEGYILLFLYDDYANRNKSWYSHIEEDENQNNTLMTSIKLYPQSAVEDITSKIILTVFTYDDLDDFDEYGNYRGNSKYSITICDYNKTC